LLNIAFAVAILDLISRVHLATFVILLIVCALLHGNHSHISSKLWRS